MRLHRVREYQSGLILHAPDLVPEEIKVDLTHMEGNSMNVGEIELPPGLATDVDPASPVVHISFVHKEEAEGEATEVETPESPEVITEAKPKDEEASE